MTQSSPLLELPAELRNKIYFDVLVSEKPLGIAKQTHIYDVRHKAPALLQTCRQIREEARTIFYSNNTFLALGVYSWIIDFFAWFKALEPKDALSIKHYRLDYGAYSNAEATWQFRRLLYHLKLASSARCDDVTVTKLISMFTKFRGDVEKRHKSAASRGLLESDVLRWWELKGLIDDKHVRKMTGQG